MSTATATRTPGPLESLRNAETGFIAHLHQTADAIEMIGRAPMETAMERLATVTRAAGSRIQTAMGLEQSIVGELVDQLRQFNAHLSADLQAVPEPLLGVAAPVQPEPSVVAQLAGATEEVTPCGACGSYHACPSGVCDRLVADRLNDLPELTEEEKNAMKALPDDFIPRILKGERPLGDPPFECDPDCPGCNGKPSTNISDDQLKDLMEHGTFVADDPHAPEPARDDRPAPKRPRKRK